MSRLMNPEDERQLREALWSPNAKYRHKMSFAAWFWRTQYPYCAMFTGERVILLNRDYEALVAYDGRTGSIYRPASREWYPRLLFWFYTDHDPPWSKRPEGGLTRIRISLVLNDFLDGKMPAVHEPGPTHRPQGSL